MKKQMPCKNPCTKEAQSYSEGYKGKNADKTKLMIIANRADKRILEPSLFGNLGHEQALRESESGKALHNLLEAAGLAFDDIYFTNAFKCLLPEDREPNKDEYFACAQHLKLQIAEFQPAKIVACGRRAYEALFPEIFRDRILEQVANAIFKYENQTPTLVTYHLSRLERMPVRFRKGVSEFLRNEK